MKIKVFVAALLTLTIPLLMYITSAHAQTFRSGQSSTISESETVDGSAYIAGASVDVSGTVNGDLYCAGQNITISGTVTGDILCAGQIITFSGTVNGNIRMAGQTISLNGKVAKSATLAGQTITLERQGSIGQDATIIGQTTTINGPVERDLMLSSVAVNIDSPIGRNVKADIETLDLASNASIGGSLDYSAPTKFTRAEGTEIVGKVTYTERVYESPQAPKGYDFVGVLIWSLMLVASAVIFALLFPRLLHTTTNASSTSVSQALFAVLIGFVAVIVAPIGIVFMMITVLGVPLAIVALIAWLLILVASGAFSAYYTGRVILRVQTNAVLIMFVGALVLVILLAIPIINVLVGLVSLWYGTGVILLRLKSMYSAPKYDVSQLNTKRTKA